jgi:hypothetical protein
MRGTRAAAARRWNSSENHSGEGSAICSGAKRGGVALHLDGELGHHSAARTSFLVLGRSRSGRVTGAACGARRQGHAGQDDRGGAALGK